MEQKFRASLNAGMNRQSRPCNRGRWLNAPTQNHLYNQWMLTARMACPGPAIDRSLIALYSLLLSLI
jgi:hypothetical protein